MKKYKLNQMEKANGQLLTVLEMVDTVEWETQQLQVFEGLKAGNSVLDAIHKVGSLINLSVLLLKCCRKCRLKPWKR